MRVEVGYLVRLQDVWREMSFAPVLITSYEIASDDLTSSDRLFSPVILPTDIHTFEPLVRPLTFALQDRQELLPCNRLGLIDKGYLVYDQTIAICPSTGGS